jgi:LysM repeat protein
VLYYLLAPFSRPAASGFIPIEEASMSLKDKYQSVLSLGEKLQMTGSDVTEEGGTLKIKGTTPYQLEKDLIWDEIKKHDGWQNEVKADIRIEKTDIYGIWEVQSGESLSKIAKVVYDNASKYMPIFEANKDILKDPNVIHPGQKLTIPNLD